MQISNIGFELDAELAERLDLERKGIKQAIEYLLAK